MKMHVVPATLPALVTLTLFLGIGSAQAGELRGRVELNDGNPAAVWIEAAGQVPRRDVVITHKAGLLLPYLSIGFVGGTFVLRNDDDTLHNTHLYQRLAYQKEVSQRPLELGATLFNVALPKAGSEVRKPIKPEYRYRDDTGFIEVVCNPHPAEHAFILVFDHPYAAVTARDGTFSIADIPPGVYPVHLWQDRAVRKWNTVEIKDGAPTEVVIGAAEP